MDNEIKVKEILDELDALSVSDSVKKAIGEMAMFLKYLKMREERGLPSSNGYCYHYIFQNGSDEEITAVAQILARLYKHYGILKEDRVTAVTKSDLVVESIGQSTVKTRNVIKDALGGILLVKNAGELDRCKVFEEEVINTVYCDMETYRGEFFVILAGEENSITNMLLCNDGLRIRIDKYVNFGK